MTRKSSFIFIILLALVLITACNNKIENIPEEPSANIEKEPIKEPEAIIEVEINKEPEGEPSPLSGIYADEEKLKNRIMAISFDNHPKARWQAGLKDAEIVYEFPVEGPYTRYLGLYIINEPKSIGPIRSARPYLVTMAYEFDAVFVHVGGSEQAKKDIRTLKMAQVDGLTSSSKVFWRDSSKRAPNNMYSSMAVLRQEQKDKGYREEGDYEGFLFDLDNRKRTGDSAKKISIIYNDENKTEYEYDIDNNCYNRFKDGKNHIDEIDKSQITAKNIIIQKASMKVLDREGRLVINLETSGEGLFITKGVANEIKWVKDSRKAKTRYLDLNGDELVLNPGTTWIQIVKPNTELIIE